MSWERVKGRVVLHRHLQQWHKRMLPSRGDEDADEKGILEEDELLERKESLAEDDDYVPDDDGGEDVSIRKG